MYNVLNQRLIAELLGRDFVVLRLPVNSERERELEVNRFLKFKNCEPRFHERNQFFLRNWTNN